MRSARRDLLACGLLLLLLLGQRPAADRLPAQVRPSRYTLAFDVDLKSGRFQGRETIAIRLDRPAPRIVLNAVDLTFEDVVITAGQLRQTARVTTDAAAQTATLDVPRSIPAGVADIAIRFSGALKTDLRGLYLSQARGRNYGVTQFESSDARRAFPCFDEPALKATFDLSLTIDRGDTAISNGRLVSDTPGPGDGRHTLTFATSPVMSSYLVAMAIGDFECIEDTSEGVPLRVCATPGKQQLGHIALGWAKDILSFYNRYYSIKYPFGKLDMVAIPDFAAGAMENTAAIFYREADLLADSASASVSVQKNIASIVAHEMAHQWFGNLVTMRWWDDLWLNEGFATWMANRPLAALKPEWNIAVDEADETRTALSLDASRTTRPIHSSVETPDDIEASFDAIAYEKGGAVLRMVEQFVGPELFRKGVNTYLEKYAYGNATSENFWTAVTSATGKPVDRVLATFVNQPGAPLIEASLDCRNGRSELSLKQNRLPPDADAGTQSSTGKSSDSWQIPVCIKTPGQSAPACQVLTKPSDTLTLDRGCQRWAFINGAAQGYFRTAYSRPLLQALAPDVSTALTPAERSSLADDEWSLMRAGRHDVADYLTLAGGFGHEQASGVLAQITGRLEFIHTNIVTDATRSAYAAWVRTVLGPLYSDLGIARQNGDSDERRALRAVVISALGTFGDAPEVQREARAALDAALPGGASPLRPIDPTTASAVVRVAARGGDRALYDRLLAAAAAATQPDEHYRYLYGLTAIEDPAISQLVVAHTLDADLRSQDTALYLGRLLSNPAVNLRTWAFVKEHWTEIRAKVGIAFGEVRIAESLGTFCTARERDDVRDFFTTHKMPSAQRSIDQSVERITACIALREKQAPILAAWLAR